MTESVPNGFLASLHAERQLRQQGKQHAKTAPVPNSAEVDDEISVDGALAVSAGGSGPATNQAYPAVGCLPNSKGDPVVSPLTRQEELELIRVLTGLPKKEAERDGVQEHIGTKCFAVLYSKYFLYFWGPFPARHAGSNFGPN